jgi:hypothetical protein
MSTLPKKPQSAAKPRRKPDRVNSAAFSMSIDLELFDQLEKRRKALRLKRSEYIRDLLVQDLER